MKKYLLLMLSAITLPLIWACGDNENEDDPTPSVTVSLRSCSITEGTEYKASELTEVTLSYNTTVTVSPSANITLNGTKCTAKSSLTTAMNVIITLPTLEEGQSYKLTIPAGAIVSKTDNTASAPAFTVNFTTKAAPQPIDNSATALAQKLGWGWNLGGFNQLEREFQFFESQG